MNSINANTHTLVDGTMIVTRYDWNLYHQAIAIAKAQYHKDHDHQTFTAACNRAYQRMMKSPDTETVPIQTAA